MSGKQLLFQSKNVGNSLADSDQRSDPTGYFLTTDEYLLLTQVGSASSGTVCERAGTRSSPEFVDLGFSDVTSSGSLVFVTYGTGRTVVERITASQATVEMRYENGLRSELPVGRELSSTEASLGSFRKNGMGEAGLEPARSGRARDFKSLVAAITPLARTDSILLPQQELASGVGQYDVT